jgi:hypothetical protein
MLSPFSSRQSLVSLACAYQRVCGDRHDVVQQASDLAEQGPDILGTEGSLNVQQLRATKKQVHYSNLSRTTAGKRRHASFITMMPHRAQKTDYRRIRTTIMDGHRSHVVCEL